MNFQEDIKKIKRLASISEEAQELVKQITGKELVSYEGIDALVAALMGFYNAELKKKSQTGHKHTKEEITDFPSAMTPIAHNHDDRYYTENETNDKLKQKLNKGNLPATITDAKGIYDLLENNGGLNIDPNLIFLNDAGTKQVGKVYLDRNKKGLFECKQQTPSTINSVDLFKDISNKSNSDKLENLEIKLIATLKNSVTENTILKEGTILFYNSDIEHILTHNKVDFMCIKNNSNGLSMQSPFYIPSRRLMLKNTKVSYRDLVFDTLITMEDKNNNICVYGNFNTEGINSLELLFYSITM